MCNYTKEQLVGSPTNEEKEAFCKENNIPLYEHSKIGLYDDDTTLPGKDDRHVRTPSPMGEVEKLRNFVKKWREERFDKLPDEEQRMVNSVTFNSYLTLLDIKDLLMEMVATQRMVQQAIKNEEVRLKTDPKAKQIWTKQ